MFFQKSKDCAFSKKLYSQISDGLALSMIYKNVTGSASPCVWRRWRRRCNSRSPHYHRSKTLFGIKIMKRSNFFHSFPKTCQQTTRSKSCEQAEGSEMHCPMPSVKKERYQQCFSTEMSQNPIPLLKVSSRVQKLHFQNQVCPCSNRKFSMRALLNSYLSMYKDNIFKVEPLLLSMCDLSSTTK